MKHVIPFFAALAALFTPTGAFAQYGTGGFLTVPYGPCGGPITSGGSSSSAGGSSLTSTSSYTSTTLGAAPCNPSAGTATGSNSSGSQQPAPSTAAVRPTVPLSVKPQVKPCVQPCN